MAANEYYEDEELEEIRRRKLLELQREIQRRIEEERRRQEEEIKREAILRQILTPEARQRLYNIKLVKPELALQIENLLIQLAASGRLEKKITDEELKKILIKISSQTKREFRIKRL